MKWDWSFIQRMQCQSASIEKETDVFPCLLSGCDGSSAAMGHHIPAGALPIDVLLQLLVGFAGTDHCAFLESGQLQGTTASECLLANAFAFDVDCRTRDVLRVVIGISAGLLPRVLLWCGDWSIS